jgi:hypothetical protein
VGGGPLNSVYIGFKVPKVSPFSGKYIFRVQVSVPGQVFGILEGSILTNLPVFQGFSQVNCYVFQHFVECVNVGAFLSFSEEYFISLKIFYGQNISTPELIDFGKVDLISDTILGQRILFKPMASGVTIPL